MAVVRSILTLFKAEMLDRGLGSPHRGLGSPHSNPGVLEKRKFSVYRRAATLALSSTHTESGGNLKFISR